MTKLEQLKKMVKAWKPSRSITMAYEICDFLYKNLDLEDEDEA
jgi:hypothetical protein